MFGSGDSFSELGESFGLRFESSQDFAAEYRKRSCDKGKAEELYIHVLQELYKSLKEGNVDSFKKFGDFIDYISTIEVVDTLTKYYSNSSNPIKNTNFVILSCKYDSLSILEYLFGSVSKILQNLTVGVGNKPILPDDEDEMRHNAFYYAIRSGNVELLGILINKWPWNYFSTHKDELNEIVSNAYEELLIKNVLLSEDMTIYVEKELVNIRFYSVFPNEQQIKDNPLDSIRERVGMVRDGVNQLQMEYLENKNVDAKFLFIAKFVTQNIHILKHQLKSTYDRLPWEEMEFCLIRYISYQIKPENSSILCYFLFSKNKILNFLQSFTEHLTDEINRLDRSETFTNLPNVKREEIIAGIIERYPEFGELYSAFEKIRNVHSLNKISENLVMALSADPKQRQGQLIITRVLHNVSELLKNTLESPNLSTSFGEFLLLSIPTKTRSVLIGFRNSISYSHSFAKRIELAQKADINLFISFNNDFRMLNFFITNTLRCHGMCKLFEMLLQSIIETNNLADVEKLIAFLKGYPKVEECEFLGLLIKEFLDCKGDLGQIERSQKSEFVPERLLVEEIKSTTYATDVFSGLQINEFDAYKKLTSMGTTLRNRNHDDSALSKLKILAATYLTYFSNREHSYKSEYLKELINHCLKFFILTDWEQGDDRKMTIFKIVFLAVFAMGDWEWADEFREQLFEIRPLLANNIFRSCCRHTGIHLKDKYEMFLVEKVSELKAILNENSYNDNIKIYKTEKKVQAMIEILLLDILSIMNDSKNDIFNDHLLLGDGIPLLLGKGLLLHLAHGNSLLDILPHDPSVALILNAEKIVMKLGMKAKEDKNKLTTADIPSLKKKFTQNLIHLAHQKQLFAALEEGNLQELKTTMKEGADINARNVKLWSALHFAAKGPSLAVVKFVLEQNIDINAVDLVGERPIHIAAANGRKNIVEFFVKTKGVRVDAIDKTKKTPLHFAAGNGHLDTINVLMDNRADPMCKSTIGFSPIHYAICNDYFGVAKVLLQKEVNVDINATSFGQTCLHLAASNGYLEIVQFLLSNGANVNAKDIEKSTPLHMASENGHLDVVKILIFNGADVNSQKASGVSPLYLATENNFKIIVTTLLQNEANVNGADKSGYTPLHVAAIHGHEEIVAVLLKQKANVYATNNRGMTPFCRALLCGHTKVAELLAGFYVSNTICESGSYKFMPLHTAAVEGYEKLFEVLIKNGEDVNKRAALNRTPLHYAAQGGRKDMIDVLIQNEVEIDARDNSAMTPLGVAAYFGNKSVAERLLECKANVNARDTDDCTPLHHAVHGGCKEIVTLFLQNGADANVKERFNATPLQLAILNCKKEIIDVLVANSNVEINIAHNLSSLLQLAVRLNSKEVVKTLILIGDKANADYGEALTLAVRHGLSDIAEILLQNTDSINPNLLKMTLLHMAAKSGNANLVNMFIRRGASVNTKDIAQLTPLWYAAEGGHEEVAEILISNGANINTTDIRISPLHISAVYGHCCVVEVLIRHGAKTDMKYEAGKTALEVAITHSSLEVVQILLQMGKMNTKLSDFSTILHTASEGNNLKMVEYLIDEGCDINSRNEFYSKPIHIAASKGHTEIVKFFLQKGLDINERGSKNRTLLHMAAQNGHTELVKFLIKQGADVDAKDDDENTPMHLAAVSEHIVTHSFLKYAAKYCKTPLVTSKTSI